MRLNWLTKLLSAMCLVIGLAGCGSGHEFLAAVQVSPAGGTATSAAANNTVQFTAIGWYAPIGGCGYGGCGLGSPDKHQTLTNANWTTSDSVNTEFERTGNLPVFYLVTCNHHSDRLRWALRLDQRHCDSDLQLRRVG